MKRSIRELREARSLSQQELASAAGLSASQLCRLESFEKGATTDVLVRLGNVLECRPEDILAAPPRRAGGQLKVAREELSLLAVPPQRIARPRWTSYCRPRTRR